VLALLPRPHEEKVFPIGITFLSFSFSLCAKLNRAALFFRAKYLPLYLAGGLALVSTNYGISYVLWPVGLVAITAYVLFYVPAK
jgi:hypothetical protein